MNNAKIVIFTITALLLATLINATALGGAVLLNQDDAKQMLFGDTNPLKNSPPLANQKVKEETLLKFFTGNFKIAIYVPGAKEPLTTQITEVEYNDIIDDKLIDQFIKVSQEINFEIDQRKIDQLQQLPLTSKDEKTYKKYLKRFANERMILWMWKIGAVPEALEIQNELYEYESLTAEFTRNLKTINDAGLNQVFGLQLEQNVYRKNNPVTTGYVTTLPMAVDELQLQLDAGFEGYYSKHTAPGDVLPNGAIADPQDDSIIYAQQERLKLKDAKNSLIKTLDYLENPDKKINKQELKKNVLSFTNALTEMRKYKVYDLLRQTAATEFTDKDNGFEQAKLNLLNYYLTSPDVLHAIQIQKTLDETPNLNEDKILDSTQSNNKRTKLTSKQKEQLKTLTADYVKQQKILEDNQATPDEKQNAGNKLADNFNQITQIITSTYMPKNTAKDVINTFKDTSQYESILKTYFTNDAQDYFIVIYLAKYAAKKDENGALIQFKPSQVIADYAKKSDALISLTDGLVKTGKYTILNGQAFLAPQNHYTEDNFKQLFFDKGYSNTGFKVLQAVYYDEFQLAQKDDFPGQTNVFIIPNGKDASLYKLPIKLTFNENEVSTFKENRKKELSDQKEKLQLYYSNLTSASDEIRQDQGSNAYQKAYDVVFQRYSGAPGLSDADVKTAAEFAGKNARREYLTRVTREMEQQRKELEEEINRVNAEYTQESSQTTTIPVVALTLPIPNYAIKEINANDFEIQSDRLELIAANAEFKKTINYNLNELKTNQYTTRLSSLVDYTKPGDYKLNVNYKNAPLPFLSLNRFIRVEGDGIFQVYAPNNDLAKLYDAPTENRNLLIYSLGNKKLIPATDLYVVSKKIDSLDKTDLTQMIKINDVSYQSKKITFAQFNLDRTTDKLVKLPQQNPAGVSFQTTQLLDNLKITIHATNNNGILFEVKTLIPGEEHALTCNVIAECKDDKLHVNFKLPPEYDLLNISKPGSEQGIKISKNNPLPPILTRCEDFQYTAINQDNSLTPLICKVEKITTISRDVFLPKIEGMSCTNARIKTETINLNKVPESNLIISEKLMPDVLAIYQFRDAIDYYITLISIDPLLLQMPPSEVDKIAPNLKLIATNNNNEMHIFKILRKAPNGMLIFSKLVNPTENTPIGTYSLTLETNKNEQVKTFGTCNDLPITAIFIRPPITFDPIDLSQQPKIDDPEITNMLQHISKQTNEQNEVNIRINEIQKANLDETHPDIRNCKTKNSNNIAPDLLERISIRTKLIEGMTHAYVYNTQEQVIATLKPTIARNALQLVGPTYSSELTSKEFLIVQFKDEKENTLYTTCGYGPLPVK